MRTCGDGRLRQHNNLRTDLHAVVEIDHVFIGEADAAARDLPSDGARCIGAVDTILSASDVHRACAKRIAGTARGHARQIGLASEHLSRWIPIRPLRLALDGSHAGPSKAFAADADAVAHRLAATEHVIKVCVRRIDDDCTGRFAAAVADDLALQPRIKLRVVALVSWDGLRDLRCDLSWSGWGEEREERFGIRNV